MNQKWFDIEPDMVQNSSISRITEGQMDMHEKVESYLKSVPGEYRPGDWIDDEAGPVAGIMMIILVTGLFWLFTGIALGVWFAR